MLRGDYWGDYEVEGGPTLHGVWSEILLYIRCVLNLCIS